MQTILNQDGFSNDSIQTMLRSIQQQGGRLRSTEPFASDEAFQACLTKILEPNEALQQYLNDELKDALSIWEIANSLSLSKIQSYFFYIMSQKDLSNASLLKYTHFSIAQQNITKNETLADYLNISCHPNGSTYRSIQKFLQSNPFPDPIADVQRIRGDGNCYYRAVISSIIEDAIFKGGEQRRLIFNHISKMIENVILPLARSENQPETFQDEELWGYLKQYKEDFEACQRILQEAYDVQRWVRITDFWDDLNNHNTQVDQYLIKTIRALLAIVVSELKQPLQDRSQAPHHGLPICMLLPRFANNEDESYQAYVRSIRRMGSDAEGFAVEYAVLPYLLGAQNYTHIIVGREHTIALSPEQYDHDLIRNTLLRINPRIQDDFTAFHSAPIFLLLNPGHYDLLRTRSQHDSMIDHLQTTKVQQPVMNEALNEESIKPPAPLHDNLINIKNEAKEALKTTLTQYLTRRQHMAGEYYYRDIFKLGYSLTQKKAAVTALQKLLTEDSVPDDFNTHLPALLNGQLQQDINLFIQNNPKQVEAILGSNVHVRDAKFFLERLISSLNEENQNDNLLSMSKK